MNINSINKINFGSIKLFKVQLDKEDIDGGKRPLKAYVSLLEKSDLRRKDLQDENWTDCYGKRTIGNDIIWDLKCSDNTPKWADYYFFGVECPTEPRGQKIKAIAKVKKCADSIKLDLLQSQTPLESISQRTHGAGACLIYLLTHMAKFMNADKIKLTSLNDYSDSFYEKYGFVRRKGNIYTMDGETISQMQSLLGEKYKASPVISKKHVL